MSDRDSDVIAAAVSLVVRAIGTFVGGYLLAWVVLLLALVTLAKC